MVVLWLFGAIACGSGCGSGSGSGGGSGGGGGSDGIADFSMPAGATDGGTNRDGFTPPVRLENESATVSATGAWDITFILDDRLFPTRTIKRIDAVSTFWQQGIVEVRSFA